MSFSDMSCRRRSCFVLQLLQPTTQRTRASSPRLPPPSPDLQEMSISLKDSTSLSMSQWSRLWLRTVSWDLDGIIMIWEVAAQQVCPHYLLGRPCHPPRWRLRCLGRGSDKDYHAVPDWNEVYLRCSAVLWDEDNHAVSDWNEANEYIAGGMDRLVSICVGQWSTPIFMPHWALTIWKQLHIYLMNDS